MTSDTFAARNDDLMAQWEAENEERGPNQCPIPKPVHGTGTTFTTTRTAAVSTD
ncbi:MAG: hypothetical protein ABJJ53_05050 [Sulfitobacter sp.]